MRIAALDDEESQLRLIAGTVESMGHHCLRYTDGKTLIRELGRETFDLMILDWQLPGVSGIDVLRWSRQRLDPKLPILFVTSRTSEQDIVEGLQLGADDYMVKPIRVAELKARVQALLRRAFPQSTQPVQQFGDYRFDTTLRTVQLRDEAVPLKPREFDLALYLFQNLGRMLSRSHLMEAVWGIQADIASRSLDTHLSRLRRQLALRPENGVRLVSAYSYGYRLEVMPPDGTASDD